MAGKRVKALETMTTRSSQVANDIASLNRRFGELEDFLAGIFGGLPHIPDGRSLGLSNPQVRVVAEVACQMDGVPPPVLVDASVETDRVTTCSRSVQTEESALRRSWTQVVRKGTRPRRSGGKVAGADAPGITVGNRFSVLEELSSETDVQPPLNPPTEVHLIGDSIVRGVRVGKSDKTITWIYPGTRVEHITTRLKTILYKATPKPVLVVHAGTNNVPMDSPRGVAERLRHLIQEARRVRSGARIVISGILPRFDRRKRNAVDLGLAVRQISQEVSLLCRQEGVTYVDASGELLKNPQRYYMRDGLHLTAEGKVILGSVLEKAVAGLHQGN